MTKPSIHHELIINGVIKAWVIPGHNEDVKARLRDDWPHLWHSLEALAHYDGHTDYEPPAESQWGPYANAREYADAQLENARHAAEVPLTGPERAAAYARESATAREWAIVQTTGEVRQYIGEDDALRAMKTEQGRVLLTRMPGQPWQDASL
jgi:hypothetical protein